MRPSSPATARITLTLSPVAANPAFKTFFPWLKPHLAGKPEIVRYNELAVSVPNEESKL